MEKNYIKFVVRVFIMAMSLTAVLILAVFSAIGWSDYAELLPTIMYVGLITFSMSVVLGSFAFIVRLDSQCIKVGMPGRKLNWEDINSIKIVGIPKVKLLNRMILIGPNGKTLEVKLFIFKDQKEFFGKLSTILPWAIGLDSGEVPLQVSKKGSKALY